MGMSMSMEGGNKHSEAKDYSFLSKPHTLVDCLCKCTANVIANAKISVVHIQELVC